MTIKLQFQYSINLSSRHLSNLFIAGWFEEPSTELTVMGGDFIQLDIEYEIVAQLNKDTRHTTAIIKIMPVSNLQVPLVNMK